MQNHRFLAPKRSLLVILAVILSTIGCTGKPSTTIAEIDAAGLNRVLGQHRGQIVLVDFWATWCRPCVALFPHAVALHHEFGQQGLAVITVSLDDVDQIGLVQKFLLRQNATTENFIATYGIGSAAFEAFQIVDGALPCVRLYDRQGNLRRTFGAGGKPIQPDEIDRAVAELLTQENSEEGLAN